MKIVLDTNCLIPVLISGSFGHDIWQAFRTGRYTLCVSTEILLEYEEIIIHMTGNREYAALVIETIANALIPPIVTQISQIYKSRRN